MKFLEIMLKVSVQLISIRRNLICGGPKVSRVGLYFFCYKVEGLGVVCG